MAPVTETVHLAARVPKPLADKLAVLAKEGDRSVSAEVRRGLTAYVKTKTTTDAKEAA